ncbi:MAG: hypothetical protein O2856_12225, partial [Planctomycetota bacterium]|nr:hypothetical protein [Planctomycetota bacterium]
MPLVDIAPPYANIARLLRHGLGYLRAGLEVKSRFQASHFAPVRLRAIYASIVVLNQEDRTTAKREDQKVLDPIKRAPRSGHDSLNWSHLSLPKWNFNRPPIGLHGAYASRAVVALIPSKRIASRWTLLSLWKLFHSGYMI